MSCGAAFCVQRNSAWMFAPFFWYISSHSLICVRSRENLIFCESESSKNQTQPTCTPAAYTLRLFAPNPNVRHWVECVPSTVNIRHPLWVSWDIYLPLLQHWKGNNYARKISTYVNKWTDVGYLYATKHAQHQLQSYKKHMWLCDVKLNRFAIGKWAIYICSRDDICVTLMTIATSRIPIAPFLQHIASHGTTAFPSERRLAGIKFLYEWIRMDGVPFDCTQAFIYTQNKHKQANGQHHSTRDFDVLN